MSALVRIVCDICHQVGTDHGTRTVMDARRQLAAQGWANNRGQDFCPGCLHAG